MPLRQGMSRAAIVLPTASTSDGLTFAISNRFDSDREDRRIVLDHLWSFYVNSSKYASAAGF
jgi:hypothetical protein